MANNNYFIIGEKLPSLNEVINANRTNRFAAAEQKRRIQDKIGRYILQARTDGTLKRLTEPCIVYMTFTEKTHRRDVDNIQSSQKFILDCLVNYQILPDDSPKWVKQIYHTIKYGSEYSCKVEIEVERK